MRGNARSGRAEVSKKETTVSEDEKVAQKHAQHQDEVEAHGLKQAENIEQGDEAAADDEVEAHRHIRTSIPPKHA
jgi:hypothetical protein